KEARARAQAPLWLVPSPEVLRQTQSHPSFPRGSQQVTEVIGSCGERDAAVITALTIRCSSGLFTRFRFRQPAAAQALHRDAGEIGLDIQDGGSVEHVQATDVQEGTLTAQELDHSEADGIWASRRAGGEYSMWPVVNGWGAEQFETLRAVKFPNNEKMGKSFDVGESRFQFGKDFQQALRVVLCAKPLRNLLGIFVRTAHDSNRLRSKHKGSPVLLPTVITRNR